MLTFARVYGPGVVFHPRARSGYHRLRRGDESIRDVMTCSYVTLTGGLPALCARAALAPEAHDLLRTAGLPWIERPVVYDSAVEIPGLVRECGAQGQRIAFQNAEPPDPATDALYLVPRPALVRLNDKAELTRFAPAEHCPPRRVMPLAEAAALPFVPGKPVVFKASTPMSTGAGGAVLIARTEAQHQGVLAFFEECSEIVVEEFLPFTRTFCLNFAADHTRSVHYIGSGDQVVSSDGKFMGSWIGPEFTPPDQAISLGREIMRRAVDFGYIGYAGFDMGLVEDGRLLVFDLNFRTCASTPTLLWFPEARRRLGLDCHARVLGLERAGSFPEFCGALRPLVEEGSYIVLGLFDPSRSEWTARPPAARGFVAGRNRAETEARCEALVMKGLASPPAPPGLPRP